MSISKRERMLLIIVALLALFGAYYLLYLKPCTDEIKELNSDIETKELQVFANEQQKNSTEQLQKEIDSMDEQLEEYGDSAAYSFDQPPVLVYLSKTVGDYAVKNSIEFKRTEQTGVVERYEISIEMTGTYDEFKKVLNALEKAPYMIRISGLMIETPLLDTSTQTDTAESTDANADNDTDKDTPTDTGTDVQEAMNLSSKKQIIATMTLDYYCLPGEIPPDTEYTFDTARQYGGDIFY